MCRAVKCEPCPVYRAVRAACVGVVVRAAGRHRERLRQNQSCSELLINNHNMVCILEIYALICLLMQKKIRYFREGLLMSI